MVRITGARLRLKLVAAWPGPDGLLRRQLGGSARSFPPSNRGTPALRRRGHRFQRGGAEVGARLSWMG